MWYVVTAILEKDGREIKQDYLREEFECIDDENAAVYAYSVVSKMVARRSGWKPKSILLIREDGSQNILVPCSWVALGLALGDLADAKKKIRVLKTKSRQQK